MEGSTGWFCSLFFFQWEGGVYLNIPVFARICRSPCQKEKKKKRKRETQPCPNDFSLSFSPSHCIRGRVFFFFLFGYCSLYIAEEKRERERDYPAARQSTVERCRAQPHWLFAPTVFVLYSIKIVFYKDVLVLTYWLYPCR